MCKDINEKIEVSHQLLKVVNAFMLGMIITVSDKEYRYATNEQPLYKKNVNDQEEIVYVATDSGIYVKHYHSAEKDTFRWMACFGETILIIKKLFDEMTADEITIVLADSVLNSQLGASTSPGH